MILSAAAQGAAVWVETRAEAVAVLPSLMENFFIVVVMLMLAGMTEMARAILMIQLVKIFMVSLVMINVWKIGDRHVVK